MRNFFSLSPLFMPFWVLEREIRERMARGVEREVLRRKFLFIRGKLKVRKFSISIQMEKYMRW